MGEEDFNDDDDVDLESNAVEPAVVSQVLLMEVRVRLVLIGISKMMMMIIRMVKMIIIIMIVYLDDDDDDDDDDDGTCKTAGLCFLALRRISSTCRLQMKI